jgi:tRNA(adenine34) deaminase
MAAQGDFICHMSDPKQFDPIEFYMTKALELAQQGALQGEVPVGALVVYQGEIIGQAFNAPISSHDPSAHAEIRALREAGQRIGNYRLVDCELYVTLEPCAMCAGAIMHARIGKLYFGANDPKTGACGSVVNLFGEARLNHHTVVQGGVLSEKCGKTLSDFFANRRQLKKRPNLITIRINLADQCIVLYKNNNITNRYPISSAANGPGEQFGSHCTPRGKHVIRAMIGRDMPLNSVFVRRRPTGEIYSDELAAAQPDRDWILTRILWLSGCEPGFNRLGAVDTMRRYIYIHGTADEASIGSPCSHGCIRMRNQDIAELFDLVQAGTAVEIT